MISFGVYPGYEGWHMVPRKFSSPSKAAGDDPWSYDKLPERIASRGFFRWCDQFVPLLSAAIDKPPDDDSALVKQLRIRIQREHLAAAYDHQKDVCGWGPPDAVGICLPYGTRPSVRRVLPVLCDNEPFGSDQRLPLRLRDNAQLCIVETALAGCLEWSAEQSIDISARVAVVTGSEDRGELTCVDLEQDERNVLLRVRQHAEIRFATDVLKRDLEVLYRRDSALLDGIRIILGFGRDAEPIAVLLAKRIGRMTEVQAFPEHRLALGAARFAAFCHAKSAGDGSSEWPDIRVEHVVPLDVGMVCRNRTGDLYWHELFGGGQRWPAGSVRLPLTGDAPESLVFAGRSVTLDRAGTWLERRQWESAGLRWLARVKIDGRENEDVAALVVRLLRHSHRIEEGWHSFDVSAAMENRV